MNCLVAELCYTNKLALPCLALTLAYSWSKVLHSLVEQSTNWVKVGRVPCMEFQRRSPWRLRGAESGVSQWRSVWHQTQSQRWPRGGFVNIEPNGAMDGAPQLIVQCPNFVRSGFYVREVSCSHVFSKTHDRGSLNSLRLLTAASSSILLSSDLTFPITVEGRYGIYFLFASLLFAAAVQWCINPARLPRHLDQPWNPHVFLLISMGIVKSAVLKPCPGLLTYGCGCKQSGRLVSVYLQKQHTGTRQVSRSP